MKVDICYTYNSCVCFFFLSGTTINPPAMPEATTLRIKKDIRANHWDSCRAIFLTLLIFVVGPLLFVLHYHNNANRRYGDVTSDLLHDMKAFYPSPAPFKSSWMEHNVLISGNSEHRHSISSDLNNMELFMTLFNWKQYSIVSVHLLAYFLWTGNTTIGLQALEIKVHRFRYFIFFIFCALYSLLLVLAMDGAASVSYSVVGDTIVKWLESSVVEFGPEEMGMGVFTRQIPHPFTMGESNPYFFQRHFRYEGEDVQFVCEYKVLGEAGIRPIFESSWWNKDGIPVKVDNRMFVNVTLQPVKETGDEFIPIGMQQFTVRNTLKINMLEAHHYGRYTCGYHDPLPRRVIVEPIFETFPHRGEEIPITPMSPHPRCECKPRSEPSKKEDELAIVDIRECFAEFELIPRQPLRQEIDVNVNIGGILITDFIYVTQAEDSDISIDLSGAHSVSFRTECCSAMTKIYWILFRGGGFVTLPITRTAWSNDSVDYLNFVRAMCICRDTPKRHSAVFTRNLFNSSLNVWETMDIYHPITLVLNASKDITPSFLESIQLCDGASSSLCGFLDMILENRFYTVYGFDVFILIIGATYVVCLLAFHAWSKACICIPSRKICLRLFLDLPVQFEAIHGPQINRIKRANLPATGEGQAEIETHRKYDCYISYCQENAFDTVCALHFKNILLKKGLTVFDPNEDILPGQLTFIATHAAIQNSSRFIIFASEAFMEEDMKLMEFAAVNDVIKSQRTKAKSRLLIILLGACEIDGLHRVPCIPIPDSARDTFDVEEKHVYRFKEWEMKTRPEAPMHCVWTQLKLYGFRWSSLIFLGCLLYLSTHSFLFASDTCMTL